MTRPFPRLAAPVVALSAAVAAAILVASGVHAYPLSELADNLGVTERVATFEDVAHTFESAYKFDPSCPSMIEIQNIATNERNIGSVLLKDVKEDGIECRGIGTDRMSLVSEATVKESDLLRRLGFPKAFAGLQQNPAALATVRNTKADSSLLVGFDEGQRICGASTYSSSTFFFFINEPSRFRIVIRTGSKLALTNITLPTNARALFITDGQKKLCLLYDKTTTNEQVVVTRQDDTGKPIGVTPTPSQSESATPSLPASPSASTAPASASTGPSSSPAAAASADASAGASMTPSASPSTGAVVVESPSLTAPPTTTDVTPSPTPTTGAGTNNQAVCFPAHARVELESGASVPISTLRLGDRVRTGASSFSDVYMFSHRDAGARAQFVRLVTAARAEVTLTASHYVYANGKLVAAGVVRAGDSLVLADGAPSVVTSVEQVTSTGLYNPHTLDGNIVVDGVLTSTFTTTVHPTAAHAGLLAPLRWLYARVGATTMLDTLASAIGSRTDSLSRMAPGGPAVMA